MNPLARSRRQERDGAARFGGLVNAMSGAGDRKNDARTAELSIEFKGTSAASYRLKVSDLIHAWVQAICEGRRMIFGIEFFPSAASGYSCGPRRYVVLPEDDYLLMHQRTAAAWQHADCGGEVVLACELCAEERLTHADCIPAERH